MTIREERRPMTAELLVCWIDPDYDRSQASDGQSRYGAYVRDHARLFDPWQDAPDGVTSDPVEFAVAAFRVATGPIMWPGFVRWHPRVCGYGVDPQRRRRPPGGVGDPGHPGAAAAAGWSWRGWERDFQRPVPGARGPRPGRPGPPGAALAARRRPAPPAGPAPGAAAGPTWSTPPTAVAAVVGSVNHTAGPVLAALEAGG